MTLRIATRRSPLARWQAGHVADLLLDAVPGCDIEIVPVETEGDRRTDVPISDLGGRGVFSKEVQRLVLDGRADLAVHSAKDLQALTPEGLVIGAFPPRGDPRDALIGAALPDLAHGAVVATGSSRRRIQLAEVRPDLEFVELRGNIATRLAQLGRCDALIMAVAALQRLGVTDHRIDPLDRSVMIPQVGQGALAVECRADDSDTLDALHRIDDPATRTAVSAERDFLAELGGDCELPAGAFAALLDDGSLSIVGLLADVEAPGGGHVERAQLVAKPEDRPGQSLARRLRSRI